MHSSSFPGIGSLVAQLELGEGCKGTCLGRMQKCLSLTFAKNLSPITLDCVSATPECKWPVSKVFLFVFANSVADRVDSTWQKLKHYFLKDIQNISTPDFRSSLMILLSRRAASVYPLKLLPLLSFIADKIHPLRDSSLFSPIIHTFEYTV